MSTQTVDELVATYLDRLAAEAGEMPPEERDELLDDIRRHIESALAVGARDEAAVRTALDRLGEPAEIVAAARRDGLSGSSGTPRPVEPVMVVRRPSITREIVAVVMLTIGSLVPIIGWLIGVVIAWTSRRWRLSEKLLATLVVPGGFGVVPLLLALMPTQACRQTTIETPAGAVPAGSETCTGFAFPPYLGIPLFLVALLGPLVVAAVLIHRAVIRAAAEPAMAVRASPWGPREIVAVVLLGPVGFVLPLIAPLIGLGFAWSSRQWSHRQKGVATVTAVLPVTVVIAAVIAFHS